MESITDKKSGLRLMNSIKFVDSFLKGGNVLPVWNKQKYAPIGQSYRNTVLWQTCILHKSFLLSLRHIAKVECFCVCTCKSLMFTPLDVQKYNISSYETQCRFVLGYQFP